MPQKKLGEMLIEAGSITQFQLQHVLQQQKKNPQLLGKLLVKEGWVSEQDVCRAVSEQLHVNYVDLNNTLVNQDIVQLIPQSMALKYNILPLFIQENLLYLAMESPRDKEDIQRVEIHAGFQVKPLIAAPGQLNEAIRRHYDVNQYVGKMLDKVEDDLQNIEQIHQFIKENQIIKLVNILLANGIKKHAGEIHVDPSVEAISVRYGIHGRLQRGFRIPKWLHYPLTARIKVMAFLDITKTDTPQSGTILTSYLPKNVGLRVTTSPTEEGERIVIQIKSNTCRKCGTALEETWKLCPNCGTAVPDTTGIDSPIEAPTAAHLPRILVADDNGSVREAAQALLEQHGYQTILAVDGEDALAKIRDELPDLAMLAVRMPRRRGFSVCQAVRSSVETMFIPVIMLTVQDSMEEKLEGLTAGVDDYIMKPLKPQEVLTQVKTVLTRAYR